MIRETQLHPADLIYPLFVRPGENIQKEIGSMPGQYQWSLDKLHAEVKEIFNLGIPSVILFGIPEVKDPIGIENFDPNGVIQQAIGTIKEAVPEMVVITDVCMCEYTDHGHCGILNVGEHKPHPHLPEGYVTNDASLEILGKVAVSHARAGAVHPG